MEKIAAYLPFLIPIAVIEIGLMVFAVVDILRHKKFKFGNTVLWIILAVVLEFIGPILYFTIGKDND
jgi:hypothetical protein